MPSKINFGEALASALAGGLQGFGQSFLQKRMMDEQAAREEKAREEQDAAMMERLQMSLAPQIEQTRMAGVEQAQKNKASGLALRDFYQGKNEKRRAFGEAMQNAASPEERQSLTTQQAGYTPYRAPEANDSSYREGMLGIEKDKAKMEALTFYKGLYDSMDEKVKSGSYGLFLKKKIDDLMGYSEPPPKPKTETAAGGTSNLRPGVETLVRAIPDALDQMWQAGKYALYKDEPFLTDRSKQIMGMNEAAPDTAQTVSPGWKPEWESDYKTWLAQMGGTDEQAQRDHYAKWKMTNP